MLETIDRYVRQFLLRNLHLKVIAGLLTLALYLWVSVDREVERTRQAPVRIDVPSGMVITNEPPNRVSVTVRGKWSDLTRLESPQLDPIRVQIDPSLGQRGRISLSPEMVDLPPGLRAMHVEPNYIPFRLEQRHQKTVRVRPQITGDPGDGYEVDDIRVQPSSLEISGPQQALAEFDTVPTEPVDVTGRRESFTRRTRPRLDNPLVDYRLDEPLKVEVDIEAQQIQRTISGLDVEPVGIDTSVSTQVEPSKVDITIRGPKSLIDALAKDEILASLDLSSEDTDRPRVVEREVDIRNLPKGVEMIEKQPRYFRVRMNPQPAEQRGE
ncbi:MAG: YbbR-like domain-containing protein [Persicimonas sp.]